MLGIRPNDQSVAIAGRTPVPAIPEARSLVAGGGAMAGLMSLPAVERHVGVSDERNEVGDLQVPAIGDVALGRWKNGAAKHGHDEQRRGLAFVNAGPFDRERERVR